MKSHKLLVICILLTGVTLALAIQHISVFSGEKKLLKEVPAKAQEQKKLYNPLLLKRFRQVCEEMNAGRESCLIEGSISTIDKSDTSQKAPSVSDYVYSKEGKDFYYRIGDTETLNAEGRCIFIDRSARKIILSRQKSAPAVLQLLSTSQFAEEFSSENFSMRSDTSGATQTISLVNEHHITCREYSVSFDTLNLAVKKVIIRLTNQDNPEGKNNERLVEIKLKKMKSTSDISIYLKHDILVKREGKWEPGPKYEGYELLITGEGL